MVEYNKGNFDNYVMGNIMTNYYKLIKFISENVNFQIVNWEDNTISWSCQLKSEAKELYKMACASSYLDKGDMASYYQTGHKILKQCLNAAIYRIVETKMKTDLSNVVGEISHNEEEVLNHLGGYNCYGENNSGMTGLNYSSVRFKNPYPHKVFFIGTIKDFSRR